MTITKRGLALFAASLMLTTSAFAQEEVKKEGVIIAKSGSTLNVRTREGPVSVTFSPDTEIRESRGILKNTRDAQSLIPGLIIKVEGTQSGDTLSADEIEFRQSDWRAAIASKAGTQQDFEKAAAERAELRQAIIDGQEYEIREEATVYFASGSTAIRDEYKAELRELAKKAPSYGNYRVSVLGFADPTGDAAANERLSARRALAVSNYLRQSGSIQPGRVLSPSAMGEGTTAPGETAPTSNEEARRVVARIITPKGQLTQ